MCALGCSLWARTGWADGPPPPPPPPPPEAWAPPPPYSGTYDRLGKSGIGLGLEASDFGLLGTVKFNLPASFALQVGLGFGYWLLGFVANADLLYEFPRFLSTRQLGMNWYLGAGATIGLDSLAGIASVFYGGGQILGGVALQLHTLPLEFTAELRPTILGLTTSADDVHSVEWYLGAGVAARFFF